MRVAAFAIWASSLALTLPLAAPAYGETLQEAVIQTLKTNPDVLIDVSRLLSLTEGANQAKGGYLPRVDLAYGVGLQRSDNLTTATTYGGAISQRRYDRSLTLSQMLFDGFATAAEVERGREKLTQPPTSSQRPRSRLRSRLSKPIWKYSGTRNSSP